MDEFKDRLKILETKVNKEDFNRNYKIPNKNKKDYRLYDITLKDYFDDNPIILKTENNSNER
ncbi:MAG: hypothetical protein MJ252_17170, partial [archaeon]|nr:hypothetical protein [archaeon]